MSKRLTAEQVADAMDEVAASHEGKDTMVDQTIRLSYSDAAGMVRSYLVPRWQAEPDGAGQYWVDGEEFAAMVTRDDDGEWWIDVSYLDGETIEGEYTPLNGRRVAPVLGRPE